MQATWWNRLDVNASNLVEQAWCKCKQPGGTGLMLRCPRFVYLWISFYTGNSWIFYHRCANITEWLTAMAADSWVNWTWKLIVCTSKIIRSLVQEAHGSQKGQGLAGCEHCGGRAILQTLQQVQELQNNEWAPFRISIHLYDRFAQFR